MDWDSFVKAAGLAVGGAGSWAGIARVWRQIDRVKQARSEGDAKIAKSSANAEVDTIKRYENLAEAAEKRAERAEMRELAAVTRADRAEERERAADDRARKAESTIQELERRIAKLESAVGKRRESDAES